MKRFSEAGEPPVVVPIVVVAVDVHLALGVPAVESRLCAKRRPSHRPLNTLRVESYSAS